MRATRAWVYVLSVAALLVPAAGIAYLGAVSYRDEHGAVAAQLEQQRQAALAISVRVDRAISAALDVADRAHSGAGVAADAALARYWFWIDGEHRLRVPGMPVIAGAETAGALDRGAACAAGRQLEDCIRELSTRDSRLARLHAAQRAEACRGDGCAASLVEAHRQYVALAVADDTGPEALLGLARVLARQGDPHAAAPLAELDARFADRAFDGVPVRLVTAMVRATAIGPDALLDVADGVLAGTYPLGAIAKLGVLDHIRSRLVLLVGRATAARRAALDERIGAIRQDARAAAGLAPDVSELVRTASSGWRAHLAIRQPSRALLYRTTADGIVGIAVDDGMLAAAAAATGIDASDEVDPDSPASAGSLHLGPGVRPLVLLPGVSPDAQQLRTLAQVPLGANLSLALVNPAADPDPLDRVIRQRSRRHVVLTSALAIALGLGLLTTIRGAARARELAQLKSDFVSTVSHELKTPLTSIRMFAEMLEQGVARGDATKMARYHGVIVQESQRLGLLIANLLDYAQIERGTRRYNAVPQSIAELARHAVTTFETLRDPARDDTATARNPIALAVSPEAMDAEVELDRDVVVQAVLNLLANAAKYGGAAEIAVAVGAARDAAWISVRDHGPGIPASEHARIFREFYRAPEAYRSGVEGTGLGLALVKRHVEALGGSVEVASVVGDGATFTIRFPRVARAAAPHAGDAA